MVDHYSHARDLMHVTWIYSFIQLEESDSWAELVMERDNHSNE
jgi:hypothetical protein